MKKAKFPARVGFHQTLHQRVNSYFEETNRPSTGDWRLFLKTGIILVWVVSAYVTLVFLSDSVLTTAISAFALAQGFILVGFNIMHDGGHGSYSRNKTVNFLMASTLDLLGGSRMLWRQKHNILHHTYTNVDGLDDDLETFGLIRLSPGQKWRFWHRFQHLYAFPLYSLLTVSWVFSDFRKYFSGRIGEYKLQKPAKSEVWSFFLGKFLFFGYVLVIPMWLHPPLQVLAVFFAIHLVIGLTVALVFQLAHTVEGNEFPEPDPNTGVMENEWSVHQVETTADFAPDNPFATWYLGGLNYQIEHHLFSKISHIHYPALGKIVRQTCADFGIDYTCYPNIRTAVVMHYRFLKKLARQNPVALQPA